MVEQKNRRPGRTRPQANKASSGSAAKSGSGNRRGGQRRQTAQRKPQTTAKPPENPERLSTNRPLSVPNLKPILPPSVAEAKPGEKVVVPKLKIYALGGLEEIGRNCTVFECGADIVIIDIGMMFPEEGMPGIDYVIPNIACLKGKEKNIRGIIVTHGHLDHIGGLPLVMEQLGNPPVYTAPLTAGLIKKRAEEFSNAHKLKIHNITSNDRITFGRHFVFEPFHVNHNISDAFGAALHTPYGSVLYTGDFKFDFTPVNDEPADLTHIAMFGVRGVLALMSDSTNAESPGHQISEKQVGKELDRIFSEVEGRLFIGTFSSLLTRAQQIIDLTEKYGRKLVIMGRSMKNNVELAHSLGYLKIKPGLVVEDKDMKRLRDDQIVVLCTGAQGEQNAVLMRIANREHRQVAFQDGDSVIFSSSVVPGNERSVQRLKDTLVCQGVKIYHYKNLDVHAGGHAKQEDLKLMLRLIKPKYLVPIHGNRFLLEAHKRLGMEVGVPQDNIFVAENGQVIEFTSKGGALTQDRVNTDYVMVDGLGVGDVSEVVLRDRVALAEDGIFVIIATVERKTGRLVGSPDIISRGFVYMRESKELIGKARQKVKDLLKNADPKTAADEDGIKHKIRNEIGTLLFKATKRRPMVLPVIIDV